MVERTFHGIWLWDRQIGEAPVPTTKLQGTEISGLLQSNPLASISISTSIPGKHWLASWGQPELNELLYMSCSGQCLGYKKHLILLVIVITVSITYYTRSPNSSYKGPGPEFLTVPGLLGFMSILEVGLPPGGKWPHFWMSRLHLWIKWHRIWPGKLLNRKRAAIWEFGPRRSTLESSLAGGLGSGPSHMDLGSRVFVWAVGRWMAALHPPRSVRMGTWKGMGRVFGDLRRQLKIHMSVIAGSLFSH